MDLIDDRTVPEDHRSGYVALVGRPNVGKSTLLNRILGQKISIVTEKPQTTRHRVLGIRSQENAQIIFLDTPGLIDPRYGLHRAMMHVAKGAIEEADLVIYLADARDEKPRENVLRHLEGRPTILAVNKTDLIEEEKADSLVAAHREQRSFAAALPISALTGYQVEELVDRIVEELPPGPPLYPRDLISEHPERFFVAEIVREKIFERFREEIPYSTQVNIVAFEERSEGKDFIDAEVVVERSSQKGMLIGKQGKAIKEIGEAARKDVEGFLQREVYLQLHVKVEENWRDRPNYLSRVGLTGRGTKRGF